MSHSKDKFVLFVPHWITRVLDREKISYSKLLNLSELRKHFSTEDISILYWLNRNHPLFAGSEGYMANDPMVFSVWNNYLEDSEFVFNRLIPMEGIAKQAIQARLGSEYDYMLRTNGSEPDYVRNDRERFEIVTLSETKLVFVVILYPGMDNTEQTALSAALLKLLYAHTGYDDMARNHLFKGYIERLALANNAL
jgi:hypothetical protein